MDKNQEKLDSLRDALEAEKKNGAKGIQNAIAIKLLIWVIVVCCVMLIWNMACAMDISTPLIIMAATIAGLVVMVYQDDREARIEGGRQLVITAVVAIAFVVLFVAMRLL